MQYETNNNIESYFICTIFRFFFLLLRLVICFSFELCERRLQLGKFFQWYSRTTDNVFYGNANAINMLHNDRTTNATDSNELRPRTFFSLSLYCFNWFFFIFFPIFPTFSHSVALDFKMRSTQQKAVAFTPRYFFSPFCLLYYLSSWCCRCIGRFAARSLGRSVARSLGSQVVCSTAKGIEKNGEKLSFEEAWCL